MSQIEGCFAGLKDDMTCSRQSGEVTWYSSEVIWQYCLQGRWLFLQKEMRHFVKEISETSSSEWVYQKVYQRAFRCQGLSQLQSLKERMVRTFKGGTVEWSIKAKRGLCQVVWCKEIYCKQLQLRGRVYHQVWGILSSNNQWLRNLINKRIHEFSMLKCRRV